MESSFSDHTSVRGDTRDNFPLLPRPQASASTLGRSATNQQERVHSLHHSTSTRGSYSRLSESRLSNAAATQPALGDIHHGENSGVMPDAQGGPSAYDPFLTGFHANELTLRNIAAAWSLELASIVIAIVMLFGIVGTVYPYNGKPLPQWPFGLSINALVSAFVVVLKICLVLVVSEGLGQLKWLWFRRSRPLSDIQTYDDASRGPLAAARLI